MTFTTVPDKSVGDPYTEQMWDSYVKDNFNKGVVRPIAEILLGSPAASLDFQSIPADFVHLMVVHALRSDQAVVISGLTMRFNNDTTANYDFQTLDGLAATPSASEGLAQTSMTVGGVPGANANANYFGAGAIFITNYGGVTGNKSYIAIASAKGGGSTSTIQTRLVGGGWRTTGVAINRITIATAGTNVVAGSRATLYGMPN